MHARPGLPQRCVSACVTGDVVSELVRELACEFTDFARDLRANYTDTYWWADHPTLRIALISVVAGGVGLAFHYAQLRMDANMRQIPPPIGAPA